MKIHPVQNWNAFIIIRVVSPWPSKNIVEDIKYYIITDIQTTLLWIENNRFLYVFKQKFYYSLRFLINSLVSMKL